MRRAVFFYKHLTQIPLLLSTWTAQTGPWTLPQDAVFAARIADIRHVSKVDGSQFERENSVCGLLRRRDLRDASANKLIIWKLVVRPFPHFSNVFSDLFHTICIAQCAVN